MVVNDAGVSPQGSHRNDGPASSVVEEIRAAGGQAIANVDDVSDADGAQRLINCALETLGIFTF